MRRGIRARSRTEYIQLDSKACKACWKCVEACPESVLGRINIFVHKHARVVNRAFCTGCRKCVKACEYGAIKPITEVERGDGARLRGLPPRSLPEKR